MGATLFKGSYDKGEQLLSLTLSDFFIKKIPRTNFEAIFGSILEW